MAQPLASDPLAFMELINALAVGESRSFKADAFFASFGHPTGMVVPGGGHVWGRTIKGWVAEHPELQVDHDQARSAVKVTRITAITQTDFRLKG